MITAVITTCRRSPDMLDRAIKSVVSQTYNNLELIVVDDSPEDYVFRNDVKESVERWCKKDKRIRYVQNEKNLGLYPTRNKGLELAEGEFIAFLDDDDEWLPEKLKKQITKFTEKDAKTAVVYCGFFRINDDSTSREVKMLGKDGCIHEDLLMHDCVGSGSFPLIRTECLRAVGGYDENLRVCGDWNAWQRLAERYEFAYIDEPLVKYYAHGGAHIGDSLKRYVESFEYIMQKNERYYTNNKHLHWQLITWLVILYRWNGEYKKCFKAWFKAISLQPARIGGNLLVMLRAFLPRKFEDNLKEWLFVKHAGVAKRLQSFVRKLRHK